jgi:hypothetical protein
MVLSVLLDESCIFLISPRGWSATIKKLKLLCPDRRLLGSRFSDDIFVLHRWSFANDKIGVEHPEISLFLPSPLLKVGNERIFRSALAL